jgi:hypothetical protein
LLGLLVLLGAHAALIAWLYGNALGGSPLELEVSDFGNFGGWALALAALAFWQWPRRTRAIAAAAAAVTISALYSPAVPVVVMLMLLAAYVVGAAIVRSLARGERDSPATPSGTVMLVGITAWTGVMAATLSFPVHYPAVYAAMLALPLVALPRDTADALRRAATTLATPDELSPREGAWVAILVALCALHLALAARPEVGHDALAMHLQFAELLNHDHRWRFDVSRYTWAVMPLGADMQFAAAYLLDGERAARLANVAFAGLAGVAVFDLVRLHARRELALASVALLLSTPLVFLETSSLFVEGLWTALLLASLGAALAWARHDRPVHLGVMLLCGAGAMQCKVISVLWLAPIFLAVAIRYVRRGRPALPRSLLAWASVAAVVALWPYVNAWLRAGNPVFPFFNGWFGSPFFDTAASFRNPLYEAPLRPWTLYDVILESGRYIEGTDGAAGLQWMLLYPLVLVGALRTPSRAFWQVLALALVFFALVFLQQSYLRYVVPFFALVAVLAAWALEALPAPRVAGGIVLVAGAVLCALNVTVVHTASWVNTTLCLRCTYDSAGRQDFIARYAPLRVVADRLNREIPKAHVGFLVVNGTGPSGFVGYSRAATWHDWAMFTALVSAENIDDVAAIVRRFDLTHIVVATSPQEVEIPGLREYVAQRTTPVWTMGDLVVAVVQR